MASAFPIWHDVLACHYKSSKSYGGKDNSIDSIYVGSSVNNSHLLGIIKTTRRFLTHETYGNICSFRLSVDGKVLKETIFKDNNGKAGELLEEVSYL